MSDHEVVIVGAGLAGLNAAYACQRAGVSTALLEASDGPGGRVRTDVVDGFRLDRGFQILLSAYPEAQAALDYDELDLRAFTPGAKIRKGGTFHRIGDPLRRPADLFATALAPIGSVADKLRILRFRQQLLRSPLPDIWTAPPVTARARLEALGFSDAMIEGFFGPLFGGITLDPELAGTSRTLDFVFRMLAMGDAVVPAKGMGQISQQLADRLTDVDVRYRVPVVAIDGTTVRLADGSVVGGDKVIVATDMSSAAELVGGDDRGWNGVTSVWFRAASAPVAGPTLMLNADGGALNSVAVMSEVSADYVPAEAVAGTALIVASAPTVEDGVVDELTADLRSWFGAEVGDWEVLRVDQIDHAQPTQRPGTTAAGVTEAAPGVFVAGDHRQDASINGALRSGLQAAHRALDGSG